MCVAVTKVHVGEYMWMAGGSKQMLNPKPRPHVLRNVIPLELKIHFGDVLKPFGELRLLEPAEEIAKCDTGQTGSRLGVLQNVLSFTQNTHRERGVEEGEEGRVYQKRICSAHGIVVLAQIRR